MTLRCTPILLFMKPAALLIALIITTFLYGQRLTTQQLIQNWQFADTSQTTKAEQTYADLKLFKDITIFRSRLFDLYSFLKHHNDQRIMIRTWMYEVLGKAEFGLANTETDRLHIQKALKMAGLLQDNQLLSELFSLYARMSSTGDNSYYTLRSLECRKRSAWIISRFSISDC